MNLGESLIGTWLRVNVLDETQQGDNGIYDSFGVLMEFGPLLRYHAKTATVRISPPTISFSSIIFASFSQPWRKCFTRV